MEFVSISAKARAERDAKIIEMFEDLKNESKARMPLYRYIAGELGISENTVWNTLKRNGKIKEQKQTKK